MLKFARKKWKNCRMAKNIISRNWINQRPFNHMATFEDPLPLFSIAHLSQKLSKLFISTSFREKSKKGRAHLSQRTNNRRKKIYKKNEERNKT
jgi:hypothetical protein